DQVIHSVHQGVEAPVSFVVRDQLSNGSIARAQVTNELICFKHSGVRVVVYRGIRYELSQCSFAAVDTVSDFLDLIAQRVEVGNEVTGSIDDFSYITGFTAL